MREEPATHSSGVGKGAKNLIDYIIVRQRDRQDVSVTKSMCGADCWTDHPLIISKMKIRILPKQRPQGKPAPKRFNVSKLNRPSISVELTHTREERTQHIQVTDDVEDSWTSFRDTMYAAAYETLGFTKRKHQDWFDENNEEITKLLEKKKRLHRAYVSDKSSARPPLATLAKRFKRSCMKFKTRGWVRKQKKSSAMLTRKTWSASTSLSRQCTCMALSQQAHLPYSALMEQCSSMRNRASWRDGQSTSMPS